MLYTVSLKSAAHWHPSFPSDSRDENKKTLVSAMVGAGVGVCLLPTMILIKSKVARWDRKTACAYKVAVIMCKFLQACLISTNLLMLLLSSS